MFARRIRGFFKPEPTRRVRWILVANRSSARIFQKAAGVDRVELVGKMDHPDQGRLFLEELTKGRPKVSNVSDAPEAMLRHAKSVETSNADDQAKRFAKTIDLVLRKGRQEKRFDELVVVAEPHYLGLLLNRLDRTTLGMVVDKIHKDLVSFSDAQIKRMFDKDWAQHERYRNPVGVNLG